jgi:serpin B
MTTRPDGWPRASRRLGVVGVGLAVVLALSASACATGTGREVRADAPADPVTARQARADAGLVWAFAADLHRAVVERDPLANVVMAPVPVAAGLAQAGDGADGATAAQIDAALGLDDGDDTGLAAAARTLDALDGARRDPDTDREGELTVLLADSLWGQRANNFSEPWLTELAETWDTGIRVADFRSDPEAARRSINEWMADATSDYVDPLLDRGDLDQFTRFVGTSGATLRAPWADPFDRRDTRLAEFTGLDGTSVTVPMMRRRLDRGARVARDDAWTAVELPYLGDDLRLTVVVPGPGRFTDVEQALDGDALQELRRDLRPTPVDVSLPQFGVTTDVRLDDALRALGVVDAFDRAAADFAGITEDEPLALAGVFHQSFLGIDEEGSEATGSPPRSTTTTTATVGLGGDPTAGDDAPDPAMVAVADRPFLVLVTDRATGVPLFYGRVVAPRG